MPIGESFLNILYRIYAFMNKKLYKELECFWNIRLPKSAENVRLGTCIIACLRICRSSFNRCNIEPSIYVQLPVRSRISLVLIWGSELRALISFQNSISWSRRDRCIWMSQSIELVFHMSFTELRFQFESAYSLGAVSARGDLLFH